MPSSKSGLSSAPRPKFAYRFETRTWSDDFREEILHPAFAPSATNELSVSELPDFERYEITWSRTIEREAQTEMRARLGRFAESFAETKLTDELILLTGMFDELVDFGRVASAFSILRDIVVERTGDPQALMMPPLGETGDVGDFPVHSDFYVGDHLMIVYNTDANLETGEPRLMSRGDFFDALERCGAPESVRKEVHVAYDSPLSSDAFDQIFGLVYETDAPWSERMRLAAEAPAYRLPLLRGEGFLLNDRSWLHGRTTPRVPIRRDRLFRAVFKPPDVDVAYA